MSFEEKLKAFLQEKEEIKPDDPDKVNKNPESKINPEKSLQIPDDIKTLKQFFVLVNPIRGEVKRNCLFRYVKDFRRRGKDVIILKGKTKENVLPFFSVDRIELSAYLASIMDDEQAMKDFTSQIESVYVTEEMELQPVDYVDFVIKNKISIMSNPAIEQFGVDAQSKEVPTNLTPKDQKELSVKPQEVEDSEGEDKSQKEEK